VLDLRDAALSVSSTSGRARGGAGHLVDPRDGRALATGRTCAVVAACPRTAEAWSTALLVLEARDDIDAELVTALALRGATARLAPEDESHPARILGAHPESFASADAALLTR
jgi:hypothetical protein